MSTIPAHAKILTLTVPEIREARIRAEVRGEVDTRTYAAALDTLESVLDQLGRGTTELREIDDAFDLAETFEGKVEHLEESEEKAAEAEATAKADVERIRKEADERCADMDVTCRELRARAEKAEHALANMPARAGNGTDTLLREYREKCEELQKRIGDQDRTLAALARVVAARDCGVDAQTLALAILGTEEHRRLSRAWRMRADAEAALEVPPAAVSRVRASRKRASPPR